MNVKILERNPNEIRLEIEGEGHTFCNVLQKTLLEDEAIEIAGYNIQHPLVSNPVVYVRMKKGRRPRKKGEIALLEAAEKIKLRTQEFKTSLEKALKEWQQK